MGAGERIAAGNESGNMAMVLRWVRAELIRATRKHGPMRNAHEAYAVILEELDEFWEQVKRQGAAREEAAMTEELVQVAAMACRTVMDVLLPAGQERSRRPRVYIAGPIAIGDREQNVARAIAVGEECWRRGWAPLVPHLNERWHEAHPHGHAEWMGIDLPWLRMADAVVRLQGESPGADEEEAEARRLGIPVFPCGSELRDELVNRFLLELPRAEEFLG